MKESLLAVVVLGAIALGLAVLIYSVFEELAEGLGW